MKIKLDLLQKNKQRIFFDYFKAAIRLKCPAFRSEGNFEADGSYKASLTADFPFEAGSVFPLRWTLTRQPDGSVSFIEIVPAAADNKNPPKEWESVIQNFFNAEILLPALAEKTKKFFRRSEFHYVGTALDGEYWLPEFRLAPALPTDDIPMMVLTERVIYIEQEVYAIDSRHAQLVAEEISKRLAARLSLILNTGFYQPESKHKWFLKTEPDFSKTTSERRQLGFVNPQPLLNALPKKGENCPKGVNGGSVLDNRGSVMGGRLVCPQETRKILRGVKNSDPQDAAAFDSCARLYQVALTAGSHFPSVSLAYQIAAVEAITTTDSDYTNFSDFMRKNLSGIDGLDKFLNWLYGSVRSAHFHAGVFPLGDFSSYSFEFPDWESHDKVNKQFSSHGIIRQAIMTWVLKKFVG